MGTKTKIAIGMIAGTALANMIQFGTYDYMRTTKRLDRWRAGIASGAVIGGLGFLALWAVGRLDLATAQVAPPAANPTLTGLNPQQVGQLYTYRSPTLAGIVASRMVR